MEFDGLISETIISSLERKIEANLKKSGIYYRLFSRIKSKESIQEKIVRKNYSQETNNLMQDIVGVRIALYFADDIPLCQEIIRKVFQVDNISKSENKVDSFSPEKLNIVCKIPEEYLSLFDELLWKDYPIDQTFEVQIRTVFSEGWHEIEHDIHYKHAEDWIEQDDLLRNLNGLLATLETCDWAILEIMNRLSYREYKAHAWSAMLKNKLHIKLLDAELKPEIIKVFDENPEFAKAYYKIDREEVIMFLTCKLRTQIPLKMDNIVYLLNHQYFHNPQIAALTPDPLKKIII